MKATLFAAFLACAALNVAAEGTPASKEVKRGFGGAYDKAYNFGHYKEDGYEPHDQYGHDEGYGEEYKKVNKRGDNNKANDFGDDDGYYGDEEDCPPEYSNKPPAPPVYASSAPSAPPSIPYIKPTTAPAPPASYPPPYAKPQSSLVTVYTTVIESICDKGLTSKEWTITETWSEKQTTREAIPQGWTQTVTVCTVCEGAKPVTKTLIVQPSSLIEEAKVNSTIAKPVVSAPNSAPPAPASTSKPAPADAKVAPSAKAPNATQPLAFTGGAMATVDNIGKTYGGVVLAAMLAGVWFL